jgi:hypothetical protein
MYKLTKLALQGGVLIDLPDDAPEGHEAVRFEHEDLARPLILATAAPPSGLTWEQAQEWCRTVKACGFDDFRAIKPVPAFALCDRRRTSRPLVDPNFLPNHAGKFIWTDQEDLTPPSGFAWFVYLDYGFAYLWLRSDHACALACRPG